MSTDPAPALLTGAMRMLLVAAGILVALAGLQLFVFTERTETYFAWTIEPPVTAAFLGAAYLASVVIELSAARERLWVNGRIAVPAVFVFTVTTLVVTLIHIDRFHLGSDFEGVTQALTWGWIAVYTIVPVVMASIWLIQRNRPGVEPLPADTLPGPLRIAVGVQGTALMVMGLGLLIAPTTFSAAWPWELTPLTGRATGAWLASIAVAAFGTLAENSARRVVPAARAYVALAVLVGWALARYPGDVEWALPAWIMVGFLVLTLILGVWALALARRLSP